MGKSKGLCSLLLAIFGTSVLTVNAHTRKPFSGKTKGKIRALGKWLPGRTPAIARKIF